MSKNSIYLQTYKSPVGEMLLGSYGNALCMANWKQGKTKERIEMKVAKALRCSISTESQVK